MKERHVQQIAALMGVLALVILVIGIAVGSGGPETEATTRVTSKPAPISASPTPTPTPTPTANASPAGIRVDFEGCLVGTKSRDFSSLQEIWASPMPASCFNNVQSPGTPSEIQKEALETAYGADYRIESLKSLYGVCAKTEGIPIEEVRSGSQARELAGAYVLCRDHPKAAVIEATIASGQALIAEEEANDKAIAEDRQVSSGKYLVGVDVQPGTWQSVGEKVTDCYWEISDAQGNILDNSFISVAPQFTIEVPAGAAGFTIQGCTFRRLA